MLTIVSSIWGVVYGLIGPFFAVYIAELGGGLEKLGFAFSVMILVQAVASYFIGFYSDRLGRRPFLFFTAYLEAVVLLSYTVITRPYQIYILQALLGVSSAIASTVRESLLGDLTKRENRGSDVGKFNAVVGIFAGAGLALGGYMTKFFGLKSIFYLGAAVLTLSTMLLFFIHEPEGE